MADHYYSKAPSAKSEPQSFEAELRGQALRFATDAGVFSKRGLDFGSRALLEAIEPPAIDGPLIDLGCGYGPIGLTLARLFPDRDIKLFDINERAVALAAANAKANRIENARARQSDGIPPEEQSGTAALVATNPPIRAGKETVFRFYSEAHRALALGGALYVVIQKKQGAPSTVARLEELFADVQILEKVKGYWLIKAIKH